METPATWGDWMGAAKSESEANEEADRLDRQKAAFGAETLAKMKDLNVLIVGMRGTGVETAKNLILSNVGGVVCWDNEPTRINDLGANFYLTESHAGAGTPRAEASLPQLKSLNPYCTVERHSGDLSDEYITSSNVEGTGKPFAAVVVTQLLPKAELFRINQTARGHGIAFILAYTSGVTASLFSDFGSHLVNDVDGEVSESQAVSRIEVLSKPAVLKVQGVEDGETIVVVTLAQTPHEMPEDGSSMELDDLKGEMAQFNNTQFKVKRLSFLSPRKAALDINDEVYRNTLNNATLKCLEGWQAQHDAYRTEFLGGGGEEAKWKHQLRNITIFNRLVLVAEQPEPFKSYVGGGLITPVKPTLQLNHKSLEESLEATSAPNHAPGVPQMLKAEDGAAGKGVETHLAYAGLLEFQAAHGRFPHLHSSKDATALVDICTDIAKAREEKAKAGAEGVVWAQKLEWGFPSGEARELDEKRIARFAKFFPAELTGFCAYLGGAAAQEVVKKTGKFTPLDQWVHHEDAALLTDECASNCGPPMGSRYDDQIAILGKDFQARAANMKIFVVGCGALGCEYLKGLSLMGAGVGNDGKIIVTDMDTIEVSNLSRQFLFRSSDVGNSKSLSGARVVKEWNPAMNVTGIEKFVGPSTEDYFTDEFWESLDLCWNALDNVKARKYTDGRCLWYSKPLLESGTTGTMSNSEVILPYRTSTYNDGIEPPEVGIAMCTLKSFPYLPLHCIEYAKQALFIEIFEFAPTQYEAFRKSKAGFFGQLQSMSSDHERMAALKGVSSLIEAQKGGAVDFKACVEMAFQVLMATFRNFILDVCAMGDDAEAKGGEPFWTGIKRRPQPVDFSSDDAMQMEFLFATANLYAFMFGVDYVRSRSDFEALVRGMNLKNTEHTCTIENVEQEGEEDGEKFDAVEKAKLEKALQDLDVSVLVPATPHDFEKDDDSNFHIDFLTIATNLRAWNYNIKVTPRHKVKVIAGRIIPALATTTAMVCGLVDIEFCKLALGLQNFGVDVFLNSNINLASGSNNFTVFNPTEPSSHTNLVETGLECFESFTSWDRIEIREDSRSVGELLNHLEQKYGVFTQSLAAEINYNPPKSIELWKEGDATDRPLSQIFQEKLASGAEQSKRTASSKRRVRAELKEFSSEPMPGLSVAAKPDDDFIFQCRLEGPVGSPYEGGTFLLELRFPDEYPAAPPALTFKTPIEHCNILDGKPCPDLLSLASWAPAQKVRSSLMLLLELLKEQDYTKPLRADLAVLEPGALFEKARAATALYATAEQAFDPVVVAEAAEAIPWHHNYLIMGGGTRGGLGGAGGEFENLKTREPASLPRIKLLFTEGGSSQAGATGAGEAAETFEAVEPDLEAKIKAMTLEVDGEPLTFNSCYQLSEQRRARFARLAPALDGATGVAVTCTDGAGETVETIVAVNGDDVEHCVFLDPIMYCEYPLTALVEAQFAPGGAWTLSVGALENVEAEKKMNFKLYADLIGKKEPDCLVSLRGMLQAGPMTRIFSGGGKHPHVPSHEGFALRMPPDEIADWQFTDDKGVIQDVPRPAHALRVWNASSRSFTEVEPFLGGAPRTQEEADKWFTDLVRDLKNSPWIGPELLDKLATSVKHTFNPATSRPEEYFGTCSNHWTELVVSTQP